MLGENDVNKGRQEEREDSGSVSMKHGPDSPAPSSGERDKLLLPSVGHLHVHHVSGTDPSPWTPGPSHSGPHSPPAVYQPAGTLPVVGGQSRNVPLSQ